MGKSENKDSHTPSVSLHKPSKSSKDPEGSHSNPEPGLFVNHPSSSSKDVEGSIKGQNVSHSGCCQLSVSMQHAGFRSIPVDSSKNKHKPRCQVFLLDLNLESARTELINMIKNQQVAAIHVALPCGTGSRARERPIPKHLIKQGAPIVLNH